jgi:hypothetical protein
VKDFSRSKSIDRFIKSILHVALFTLCMKVTLQLMSGIPFIADLAYQHRNFIIAYLHTVLLGFISLFSFAFILHSNSAWVVRFKPGIKLFIFSLVTTNGLLVMEALGECYHFYIPSFSILLLIATLFFPLSIWIMISNLKKKASLERLARI